MKDYLVREKLKDLVDKLNEEEEAIVIVEGRRDREALKALGYRGNLIEFCKEKSLDSLILNLKNYKKAILLLDLDEQGKALTAKLTRILTGHVKVDLFYRKKLREIGKGKITAVQNLLKYSF